MSLFCIRYSKYYLLAILVLFFSACASQQPQQPGKDKKSPAFAPQEIREFNSTAKRDEKSRNDTSSRSRFPRFDVQANNVPARQFFLALVKKSPYSLTVHPEVEGKISLQMKNATLPRVLEEVRNLYGYPFRRTDVGYRILPAGVVTRTFHVNYPDIERKGGSQTQVRSGSISQGEEDNKDSSSVTSTNINTSSESSFWSSLQTTLSSLLGEGGKKRVITQPHAGLVVVRAHPRELEQVEDYLQTMQKSIQRQVVMETKIIEVRLNKGHRTGINWSALLSGSEDDGAVISQTGGGSVVSEDSRPTSGNSIDLSPDNPDLSAGRAANAFGGVFSAALNIRNFTAFIELLKEQGDVNVLSSPRVSTMNNQKAVIKVGTDQFYVTDVTTEDRVYQNADERDTQINDVTLDPFFSGISLDVTPFVSSNDMVTMHIHPSVSDVSEVKKTLQLGGDQISLPLAQSDVRESDSVVRAETGEVVIIGGLMKTRNTTRQASVPILGDIPLLGYAFRHEKKVRTKSELVILLRPEVVSYGRGAVSRGQGGKYLDPEKFGQRWRGENR